MKYSIRDAMENKTECCICGKKIKGYGNNPWPIAADGRCCNECNMDVVIPARLKMHARDEAENQDEIDRKNFEAANKRVKEARAEDMKSTALDSDIEALKIAVDFSTDAVYDALKKQLARGEITERELQDRLNYVEDHIHKMLKDMYYKIRDIGKMR